VNALSSHLFLGVGKYLTSGPATFHSTGRKSPKQENGRKTQRLRFKSDANSKINTLSARGERNFFHRNGGVTVEKIEEVSRTPQAIGGGCGQEHIKGKKARSKLEKLYLDKKSEKQAISTKRGFARWALQREQLMCRAH